MKEGLKKRQTNGFLLIPVQIGLIYAVFGFLGILVADGVSIHSLKRFLYVLLTAIPVYLLIRITVKRMQRSGDKLKSQKQLLEKIAKRESLKEILNEIVHYMEQLSEEELSCAIFLFDPKNERLYLGSAPNLPRSFVGALEGMPARNQTDLCSTAAFQKETMVIPDVRADYKWKREREMLLSFGFRACWAMPVVSAHGNTLGVLCGFYPKSWNITERELHLAETCSYLTGIAIEHQRLQDEAVHESEAKYRLIAENMTDLIALLDPQGNLKYVSPSHAHIFGYSLDKFKERFVIENLLHPKDQEIIREMIERMNHVKQPGRAEARFQTAWGSWIDVEMEWKPILGNHGELANILIVARNVMERKKAEKRLEESQQRYKSLFMHNPDLVLSMDLEGKILGLNPAAEVITGYRSDEIINRSIKELINAEDMEKVEECFEKTKKGEPQTYMLAAQHKSGRRVILQMTFVPIVVDGQIVGVFGIAKDITEQKKIEELVRKSEKLSALGQLAACVAHEIRNPLTALKGFAQLMKNRFDDPKGYLNLMLSEIDRINQIISEFLLLSKPDQVSHFAKKDVRELLGDVIKLYENEASAANIRFLTRFAPDIPPIHCQENRLKQVFINLVKNAMEAMEKGGTIRIEAEHMEAEQPRGGNVRIRIIDEGCGIPEQCLDKLGEPFFTLKEDGTGLGLMVSYKIIEDHRGNLAIESEPDRGTCVQIDLPVERGPHL